MPAALLRSQFDALEPLGPDERRVVVDLSEVQDSQDVIDAFLAEAAAITRGADEGEV